MVSVSGFSNILDRAALDCIEVYVCLHHIDVRLQRSVVETWCWLASRRTFGVIPSDRWMVACSFPVRQKYAAVCRTIADIEGVVVCEERKSLSVMVLVQNMLAELALNLDSFRRRRLTWTRYSFFLFTWSVCCSMCDTNPHQRCRRMLALATSWQHNLHPILKVICHVLRRLTLSRTNMV